METTQKYEAIISAIDLDKIYRTVTRKSRLGASEEAMIISTFVRYIERIPTIKDRIKRLRDNLSFNFQVRGPTPPSLDGIRFYLYLLMSILGVW